MTSNLRSALAIMALIAAFGVPLPSRWALAGALVVLVFVAVTLLTLDEGLMPPEHIAGAIWYVILCAHVEHAIVVARGGA